MVTITGNPYVDLKRYTRNLVAQLAEAGIVVDNTGEPGPVECVDSGEPNGGDGGGNLVEVICSNRHGLESGKHIRLVGCNEYSGEREIEVIDEYSFYILNVAYSADVSGSWEPL